MVEKLYGPLELIRRLEAEHDECYVYRGEARLFPAPMWPSNYRRYFASERSGRFERQTTIRGCGEQFFFRLNMLRDPFNGSDNAGYDALVQKEKRRSMCMTLVRNALGYPFAEAMFQQAGWSSEGIDVSFDPRVAMTFALSTWTSGRAQPWARPDPAVVYRFRVERRQWTFDDLRAHNYFSCPTFLPTRDICRLFRTGGYSDFLASLNAFREAINWDIRVFDLDKVQRGRPHEIIEFPTAWLKGSRVARQHAGLLLPDSIRSDSLRELVATQGDLGMMSGDVKDQHGRRVSVRDCLARGNFVEDVRTRTGVEKFVVDVSDHAILKEVAALLDLDILPQFDVCFDLLNNWVRPFYSQAAAFGGVLVDLGLAGLGIDPLLLNETIADSEPERRFCQ